MPKASSSAENAARQAERRRIRNRASISAVKTYMTRARKLIAEKNLSGAQEAVRQAVSTLDRVAQRKVMHPNTAARQKSHLAREFNAAFPEASAPAKPVASPQPMATETKSA